MGDLVEDVGVADDEDESSVAARCVLMAEDVGVGDGGSEYNGRRCRSRARRRLLCCSVLQCVAVCCSVLQCVGVCWSVLM